MQRVAQALTLMYLLQEAALRLGWLPCLGLEPGGVLVCEAGCSLGNLLLLQGAQGSA